VLGFLIIFKHFYLIKIGNNWAGQLGYGDTTFRGDNVNEMGSYLPFVSLGSSVQILEVVLGFEHSCFLSSNDQMKCWG